MGIRKERSICVLGPNSQKDLAEEIGYESNRVEVVGDFNVHNINWDCYNARGLYREKYIKYIRGFSKAVWRKSYWVGDYA